MTARSVIFFCMAQRGHLHRILPLVAAFHERGLTAHVFTHRSFARDVEERGGRFVDLFAAGTTEEADPGSIPPPFRYLGFAARVGADLTKRVALLRPAAVVYDSFAIVGQLVARRLGVPFVNVCAGHDVHPGSVLELLPAVVRPAASPTCLRAARELADELELAHDAPFQMLCAPSPFLNVYCEPPELLEPRQRRAFEPVEFFGSVDVARADGAPSPWSFPERSDGTLRVYVSFGTLNGRYWPAEVASALKRIAADLGDLPDVRVTISLGGNPDPDGALAAALARPYVRVASYVPQWQVLRRTDLFITHHGLNSTHEAVYHRVPMLSVPFFWDQPALARRCQQLGLALPLGDAPRAPLAPGRTRAALARARDERPALARALAAARGWEDRVIAERPRVVQRIIDLM